MNNVVFSIIIPVYNVKDYVEKCVESACRQNIERELYEIIIVDDGSTDGSDKIIEKFSIQSNVRIFHKKNEGLSETRNFGVRKATGEYVLFLDSDDYIEYSACQNFLKIIENNKKEKIDMLVGIISREEADKSVIINDKHETGKYLGMQFLRESLLKNTFYVTAWANIYNREFLLNNKLFFPKGLLHEDEEFTIKSLLKADSVIVTDILFYHYLIRENSIMTQKDKTQNAVSIFEICRKMNKEIDALNNEKLQRLLKTHYAKLCFNIIEKAQLYKKNRKSIVDKKILKKYCIFFKEKFRYCLYSISPNLLHWVVRLAQND